MDIKPIEEKLRELILSNYKSIRDFSIKIDVPYTTIDTILRRGVDKANIIADFLEVTEEFLIEALRYYNNKYGACAKIDEYTILFTPTLLILKNFKGE